VFILNLGAFHLATAIALSQPGVQSTSADNVVSGTVFDSVSRRPLAGAIVQIVRAIKADSVSGGIRTFAAVSDVDGRYRISALPLGTFAIGFQHNALDALGLEAPISAFEIPHDGTSLTIDLAIPSGAHVRATHCPTSATSDGMLAGFLLDAASETILVGAKVRIEWTELVVAGGIPRATPRRIVVSAAPNGAYRACGLPSDTPLAVVVAAGGYRSVAGELTVPDGSTLRQDFRLLDTTAVARTGAIDGHVVSASGEKIASGMALLPARGLRAPVRESAFAFRSIPGATWGLEVRVPGYQPTYAFIDVVASTVQPTEIVLRPLAQQLNAVNVVGKGGRDQQVLEDIKLRARVGRGTRFLPGNQYLTASHDPMEVVRMALGFQDDGYGNPKAQGCKEIGSRGKHMAVYLDGEPMPDLRSIRDAVPMSDILAIEAYSDAQSVPFLWRHNNVCAAVAVWRRH
jgi:hypothetical protein